MKEEFLHYLWKFQKFNTPALFSERGETITVIHPGEHNTNAGPDFFNAKLKIGNQLWAGNVEIHLNASDWYAHNHEKDSQYDSVILHVVWKHDGDIFRRNKTALTTLVIKPFVNQDVLKAYKKLSEKQHKWIPCEHEFANVDSFVLNNWLERLFIERLEKKSKFILELLEKYSNNWEAVLFILLTKNFGLQVNSEAFLSVANSIDFSIFKKVIKNQKQTESLFFGQAGLLEEDKEEHYYIELQKEYAYLKHAYSLNNKLVTSVKYFRLRPTNFPTIRLSQLASLYVKERTLFSKLIEAENVAKIYDIFNVSASSYWDNHYSFGVVSAKRKKKLSKKFIDLLIINTLVPMVFCYRRYLGNEQVADLFDLLSEISSEENSIIKKFDSIKKVSTHALYSQGLLQLKTMYCDKKRCLDCVIGASILGKNK